MDYILENPEVIPIGLALLNWVMSYVAAFTKTPKDDELLAKVYKWLVDVPAGNVFKAKDKG